MPFALPRRFSRWIGWSRWPLDALRRRLTIGRKLALLYTSIFGVTLVGFCALLYMGFVRLNQNEFDTALYNHAVDISSGLRFDLLGRLVVEADSVLGADKYSEKIFPFPVGKEFIQVLDLEGRVLAKSNTLGRGTLPQGRQDLMETISSGVKLRTLSGSDILGPSARRLGSFRMILFLSQGTVPCIVQVAVPTTLLQQESRGLLYFLLVSVPLTLVVAALGGLYLSRKALRPIRDIEARLKNLNPRHLEQRLPILYAVDDEIFRLTVGLNGLLERMQNAFEAQERFVSDASHELKTPLAVLRAELDLFQTRPRDTEETKNLIKSASQELDHLSRVIADLLTLARMDSGYAALTKSPVRLDEICLEVVSRLERVARAKQIRIKMDLRGTDAFEVFGDADLLQSLVQNLLENAIKFSSADSAVNLVLDTSERGGEDKGGGVACIVEDYGKGIPSDLLPHLFHRFARGKDALRSAIKGHGLGLAIAKRISDFHGASLEVESPCWESGGTRFRVRFPKISL